MRLPILLLGAVLFGVVQAQAQDAAPHFTVAQADRGADIYRDRCALCHGLGMDDGEFGPSLKGARFKAKWGGRNLGALFAYLTTSMPPGQTASLGPQDYADVMARILQANGAAPSARALPSDLEALSALTIDK